MHLNTLLWEGGPWACFIRDSWPEKSERGRKFVEDPGEQTKQKDP